MAERVVRHAVVTYTLNGSEERAFRGQTINVQDDAELERLEKFGAVVATGVDLARPGTMMELPVAPSAEELLQWVISATESEVRELISTRPDLAVQILGAQDIVVERMAAQREMLGQAVALVEEHLGEQDPGAPESPTTQTTPVANAGTAPTDPTAYADQVVGGNVQDVSRFLGENPSYAQSILDAENRRVEAARAAGDQNEQPRQGVVRAVQAALGHTQ